MATLEESSSKPSRDADTARNPFALVVRGAWGRLVVAALLITVIPGLVLLWVRVESASQQSYPETLVLAGGVGALLMVLGYALLFTYPINIVRLRTYLQTLAQNRLPRQVILTDDEDDIVAIRYYLDRIVHQAEERLRLIEDRHTATLEAERHRIMVESIGALCHHVGQPATVLGMSLHRMERFCQGPDTRALLAECHAAFDDVVVALDRLRELTHYRTEPYLAADPAGPQIIRMDRSSVGVLDSPDSSAWSKRVVCGLNSVTVKME